MARVADVFPMSMADDVPVLRAHLERVAAREARRGRLQLPAHWHVGELQVARPNSFAKGRARNMVGVVGTIVEDPAP